MDPKAVVDELVEFGLTRNEAKCYVSLTRLGPADPLKVSEDSGVPRTNSYQALDRLAAMGWVDLVTNRPAIYRAKRPQSVKSMLASRMVETFEALERTYNTEPAEEAELVYTIRGRERVLSKVSEMISGSKESIVVAAPTMALREPKVLRLIGEAANRSVKVRVVGDQGASSILPNHVLLRTGNLIAVDLLIDDEAALIALPDYSACGWIESPQVARHFKQFLELMWSNSRLPGRR